MLKIGLTGGIGSGKTKVSKIFAEKGFKIFNSDQIAKKIIRNDHSVKKSIINFFGTNSYIGYNLNSKYISEIVYSDNYKLNYLNSLVHPKVFHQFEKFLKSNLNIPIVKTAKDSYNVKIRVIEGATSVTKDTTGVTTREKIIIVITFEIIDQNNKVISKERLSDNKTVRVTNNISTDAEIRRIEKENKINKFIEPSPTSFDIKDKIASPKRIKEIYNVVKTA